MGTADTILIIGAVGIPIAAYIANLGGFRDWVHSMGQPVEAAPKVPSFPRGTGKTPITSTLCKCGSGTAKHVVGDCNSCKNTCAATCGNCSPQCLGTKTSVPASMGYAETFATYPMRGLIVS